MAGRQLPVEALTRMRGIMGDLARHVDEEAWTAATVDDLEALKRVVDQLQRELSELIEAHRGPAPP